MEQVGGENVGLDSTFSLLLPPLPALLPVVRLPIHHLLGSATTGR